MSALRAFRPARVAAVTRLTCAPTAVVRAGARDPTPSRCSPSSIHQTQLTRSRCIHTTRFLGASITHTPSRPPPSSTPPPSQFQEDYQNPAIRTYRQISLVVRYTLYAFLFTGTVSFVGFEALHLYVEHRALAAPSRTPDAADEYGWQEENVGWTGGVKGGTDPRLGWKGRHALRGAWICQEWGAGLAPSTIGSSKRREGTFVPEGNALQGMIGAKASPAGKVDRGFELAEDYLEVAIRQAKARGIIFPEPSVDVKAGSGSKVQADPTAVELLVLKAGILERINTTSSLIEARELYETVLGTSSGAAAMRLAGKIGDLAARVGDGEEAMRWWTWGLDRAGLQLPGEQAAMPAEVHEKRGWFGRKTSSSSSSSSTTTTTPAFIDSSIPTSAATLSPPQQRAVISLLVSASTHLALSARLAHAQGLQSLALSLAPASPTAAPSDPAAHLHDLWLQHRRALLTLHSANILHALSTSSSPSSSAKDPLELATASSTISSSLLPLLPTPSPASALYPPTKQLRKDAHALAAEALYTRGLLLEKRGDAAGLEMAGECFERAMSVHVQASGRGEDEAQGEEWGRYTRGLARVRGKLGKGRSAGQ